LLVGVRGFRAGTNSVSCAIGQVLASMPFIASFTKESIIALTHHSRRVGGNTDTVTIALIRAHFNGSLRAILWGMEGRSAIVFLAHAKTLVVPGCNPCAFPMVGAVVGAMQNTGHHWGCLCLRVALGDSAGGRQHHQSGVRDNQLSQQGAIEVILELG